MICQGPGKIDARQNEKPLFIMHLLPCLFSTLVPRLWHFLSSAMIAGQLFTVWAEQAFWLVFRRRAQQQFVSAYWKVKLSPRDSSRKESYSQRGAKREIPFKTGPHYSALWKVRFFIHFGVSYDSSNIRIICLFSKLFRILKLVISLN